MTTNNTAFRTHFCRNLKKPKFCPEQYKDKKSLLSKKAEHGTLQNNFVASWTRALKYIVHSVLRNVCSNQLKAGYRDTKANDPFPS